MPFNVERLLLPVDVVTVSFSIGYSSAVDNCYCLFEGIAPMLMGGLVYFP